jgi:hypothetical protein
MKHSSSQSNQSFRLPDFDHRLNMYAVAASAAGVSMLALAEPAEGKIIYTKANKTIGLKDTLRLDLNHDGIADFDLKNTLTAVSFSAWDWLSAIPAQQKNAVWGHTAFNRGYASALSAGSWVGPKGQFLSGAGLMATSYANNGVRHALGNGPWANVTNRYLGLKFLIKGKTHFGWARLTVTLGGNVDVSAALTGYAYETIPNKPILTGKEHGADDLDGLPVTSGSPATLGRLALGSAGRPIK